MRKLKIFLSCGQREEEKGIGEELKKRLESNNEFGDKIEIYFAEKVFSPEAVTENIYSNLRDSDSFVAIFHKREFIGINKETKEKIYRTSLFVNQELAIASYLELKPFFVFAGKGVENNGIYKYLMGRFLDFTKVGDILKVLEPAILEKLKMWHPNNKYFQPIISTSDILDGHGIIEGIKLQLSINNLVNRKINELQVGILTPKNFEIGKKENEYQYQQKHTQRIDGILGEHYFIDDNDIGVHYIFKGSIMANAFEYFTFDLYWRDYHELKEIQLGIYVIADNKDFRTYNAKFDIYNNNRIINVKFEENTERVELYCK